MGAADASAESTIRPTYSRPASQAQPLLHEPGRGAAARQGDARAVLARVRRPRAPW